jgi:hypothetical protein
VAGFLTVPGKGFCCADAFKAMSNTAGHKNLEIVFIIRNNMELGCKLYWLSKKPKDIILKLHSQWYNYYFMKGFISTVCRKYRKFVKRC